MSTELVFTIVYFVTEYQQIFPSRALKLIEKICLIYKKITFYCFLEHLITSSILLKYLLRNKYTSLYQNILVANNTRK